MPKLDPITFAVVRNKFISIANAMQETALRTEITTFMYEIKDCSFSILDAQDTPMWWHNTTACSFSWEVWDLR